MTRLHARLLLAAAALAAALGSPASAPAAELASGAYTATVELGPLLLDGRYPFVFGEGSPGTIDLTTSATGQIAARVSFGGQSENAVGKIIVRAGSVRLSLRGKADGDRVRVSAALKGASFVGTATLLGQKQPCSVDISTAGPLRARYALALTTSASGVVTGTGTFSAGHVDVPVKARGRSRKGRLSLVVAGGSTLLKINGARPGTATVFAPRWSVRGFGASAAGRRPLRLAAH